MLFRSGQSLLAVKTNDGTLWRISLVDDGVAEVKLAEPVTKGDGLVLALGDLFVVRNFENRISRIDLGLGSDEAPRPVITWSPEDLNVPTTAVFVPGRNPSLMLVNSQFGKDPPSLPFSLVTVPID